MLWQMPYRISVVSASMEYSISEDVWFLKVSYKRHRIVALLWSLGSLMLGAACYEAMRKLKQSLGGTKLEKS